MNPNEKYNRIRPLKIWEILQKETDEYHPMGTNELIAKLAEEGSMYIRDFNSLYYFLQCCL